VKFTNGVGGGREEKRKNRMATTAAPFATLFFFYGALSHRFPYWVWPSPSEFRVGDMNMKTSIFYSFGLIAVMQIVVLISFFGFVNSVSLVPIYLVTTFSWVRSPLSRIFEALKVPASDHAWHNIVAESSTTTGCRDHKGGHSLPSTRCQAKRECSVGYLESS
jgi:hypothetical protein